MKARNPLLALLALGALLALAPAAQAATPFTAGTGNGHDLAVGSDGTGHLVWITDEAADRVGYCRIPPGGTACDSESTFLTFPDTCPSASSSGDHAQVFTPAPGEVVILASCIQCPTGDSSNKTYRFTSISNGAVWSAAVHVGSLELNGQCAFISNTHMALSVSGAIFQGQNNPPAATDTLSLGSSPTYVYDASVAVGPGPTNTKAVYAVNDLHTVWYRVFTDPGGRSITEVELNSADDWSASPLLLPGAEGNNDETMLSSGPNGVYLTYRFKQPTENRLGLRKFDAATDTFGAASYIEGDRHDREQRHRGVAPLAGRLGPAARGVALAPRRQPAPLPPLGRRRRDLHPRGEPRHGRDLPQREGGSGYGRNRLCGLAEQWQRDPGRADRPTAGAGRARWRWPGHHAADRRRLQGSATRRSRPGRAPASASTRARPAWPC